MTVIVDPEFLSDENTAYPIRIDPTIEICYDSNGSGAIEDVTINSLDTSSGASGALYIGNRQTYGISRVLMKFPGLDLSTFGDNIIITDAKVEIRDIMCETEALKISCYAFTGNTWSENNVDWSSVYPNAISTFLSSNTVSYENGRQQTTAHRYSFDITKAVDGWRVGNYTQSRGIIFKADSNVENGTTYIHKTFASYNRSSNKPSLSVTYNSTDNFITKDSYYLNNYYSGDYLKYTNSAMTAESGLLANLGNSVQWEINSVDGGYVIRSKADPTKYLGVPTDTSANYALTVTLDDRQIPTRCIWTINTNYNIKNVYNSRYLYSHGDGLYTSSHTGGYQNSRKWRMPTTSHYGNSSSYTSRELTSETDMYNKYISVAKNVRAQLMKANSNEVWCDTGDFWYSDYSSIITVDTDGLITAKATGTTTVNAIHKVTNRIISFTVTVSPLLIYQTVETYYTDKNGNYAPDLICGDMTEKQLRALDWITWTDFIFDSPEYMRNTWEIMAAGIFSVGEMRSVSLDMIDHFMCGSGTSYSNSILTNEIKNHSSTIEYTDSVQRCIMDLLNEQNGNMSKLSYTASNRSDSLLRKKMEQNGINNPVYNGWDTTFDGPKICVDSLWGVKIQVDEYSLIGSTYTCKIHYTLYDHFGLDVSDVEKYGAIEGFRAWFVLQHFSEFNQAYKPFLTLIEFDKTITDNLS